MHEHYDRDLLSSAGFDWSARPSGQYPKRRNQDALGLLVSDRPATPALTHRPLPHATLQPDDMPHARARRAADPAQRPHRVVHATARMKLPLGQVRLAPGARHDARSPRLGAGLPQAEESA
jgi:hypothetical protein